MIARAARWGKTAISPPVCRYPAGPFVVKVERPERPARRKGRGMQYMLLIYGDESTWAMFSPEEQAAEFQKYDEYTKWLQEKGWMRAGEPLQPSATTTQVRVRDGQTLTTDGPFAETKEQLGGYYLLDVADLDEAIKWAHKCPGAKNGRVELRPIMEFPDA
jgi:hypothetical protein